MRRNKAVLLCGAVLALGGAGVAVAATSNDQNQPAEPTNHAAPAKEQTAGVDAHLASQLSVLRDQPPATLPASIRTIITDDLANRAGANPDLARRVDTTTGPLYIVPGNASLCQISQAGIGCGDSADFGKDPRAFALSGFSRATNDPGTITISGIVPDRVSGLDVVLEDGTTQPVTIAHNAYSATIPDSYSKLIYREADGSESVAEAPGHAPEPTPPNQ